MQERSILFKSPWLSLVSIKTPDPEPYYALDLPNYVCVIPRTVSGEILMIKQFRPAVGKVTLEFPAGTVEEGELELDTAGRELEEETAYRSDKISLLGVMTTDAGRINNVMHSYFAENCVEVPDRQPEEGIEVLSFSVESLFEMVGNGEFAHALHLAPLFLAREKKFL